VGLVVVFTFVAGVLVTGVENLMLNLVVLGLAACWAIPFWKQLQSNTLDIFEPIHLIGFIYLVSFGIGSIWVVADPKVVAYDWYIVPYILKAATLCLFGYVMMLAGYYGPWFGRRRHTAYAEYPAGIYFYLIPTVLGLFGWAARIVWFESTKTGRALPGLVSSISQLSPLFTFVWALAWMQFLSRQANKSQRMILFGLLCPAALVIVLNALNHKTTTMALIGIPLMALWYTRRHIPWVPLIALLLILIFVVFPFSNTFRSLDYRIPMKERAGMTLDVIRGWDMNQFMRRSYGTFKNRMALINVVAVVIRDVPRWVPYANGRTIILPFVIRTIPRFIWPDKPKDYGREFGETFRIVHILDTETSVAATIPGELYWNFSIAGVLIGMALWGMFTRFIYRRFAETDSLDPISRAIYIVMLLNLLRFEAGIAVPLTILVRTLVILVVYRWCARYFGLIEVRTDKFLQGAARHQPSPTD
jgi:hypothetical protein